MGYWFSLRKISTEPILDKMGIPYDLTEKHKGIMGKDLGVPEKPLNLKVIAAADQKSTTMLYSSEFYT